MLIHHCSHLCPPLCVVGSSRWGGTSTSTSTSTSARLLFWEQTHTDPANAINQQQAVIAAILSLAGYILICSVNPTTNDCCGFLVLFHSYSILVSNPRKGSSSQRTFLVGCRSFLEILPLGCWGCGDLKFVLFPYICVIGI